MAKAKLTASINSVKPKNKTGKLKGSVTGTSMTTKAKVVNSNPKTTTTKYKSTYTVTNPTQTAPYQQSQAVTDAQNRYNTYLNAENRPTYQSQYANTIKALADKIANRKEFSYDFNADPLYQNYKDQYTRQAQLGQQGAMAQAAALSGGYGNSYAATAGNLAYQENMSQLNNVIPELYNAAMQKYENDIAGQRADLSMYQGLEDTDYGRFRDSVNDWNTDRDFYGNEYWNQRNTDYNQYRDTVADTQWRDDFIATQSDRAQTYNSSEHWNKKDFNYQKKRDKISDKFRQKELDIAKKGRASSSSGRSGGGYSRSSGSSGSGITANQRGVYSSIAKFKGGNSAQQKVAWNSLNGTLKDKYGLSDSQIDYLYYNYLGFGSSPKTQANEKVAADGAHTTSASKAKYQTISDIPKKYQDKVLDYTDFVRNMPSDSSLRKYKSYPDYLAAMVKKLSKKKK